MSPEDRKLSTSDIAAAMDRQETEAAERERLERERREREPLGHDRPGHEHPQQMPASHTGMDAATPLFAVEELSGYRTRWSAIQTGFVDEPRRAVEEADTLVAELMKRLADVFADERRQLEGQWEKSDAVSTEDLRIAMRRYRSFFERLLSV
jgi:hypothetical protein